MATLMCEKWRSGLGGKPNGHPQPNHLEYTQPAFNCSELTIETLEQGVKYIQS